MPRVWCLALMCMASTVAGCGIVRQGLPVEEDAGRGGSGGARPADGPMYGQPDSAPAPGGPPDGPPRAADSAPPPRPPDGPPAPPPDGPLQPTTRGLGEGCEGPGDCRSGYCIDGVCCVSACAGTCEACDLPGLAGACAAVSGAPRGSRGSCLGTGTPCAGRCDGESRATCKYPAGETECAAASCAGGLATARAVCSGTGVCLPATMVNCAPFACNGPICGGGCTGDSGCLAGNFCSGGRCLPLGSDGDRCQTGDGCASGFCTSGRCCNRRCNGACESCDLPGQAGRCGSMPFVDVNNCGGCGSRCSSNHIRAICSGGGRCVGECNPGFADCNGDKRGDGCEVDVRSDAQNCGGCGQRCPGTGCVNGSCEAPERIEFTWSFIGPVAGLHCISLNEPSDPDFWSDNFLCTQRDFGLTWSVAGEVPGQVCTQINEPSDPNFWSDNFLCAPVDYGLRWSFIGPIDGLRCTQIDEPADPHFWSDNFLCAP